jgi:hypothetical protein
VPREDAATKARRYVSEGRLIVRLVSAEEILATARGDGAMYQLGFSPGRGWWCECPAVTDQCSHLRGLRLVTIVQRGAA